MPTDGEGAATIARDKNELVIYYDQGRDRGVPTVTIDEFTLISQGFPALPGAAAAAGKVAKALEVSANVAQIVDTVKGMTDPAATAGPRGGGGAAPTPAPVPDVVGAADAVMVVALDEAKLADRPQVSEKRLDDKLNPFTDKVTVRRVTDDQGKTTTYVKTELPGWVQTIVKFFGGDPTPDVDLRTSPPTSDAPKPDTEAGTPKTVVKQGTGDTPDGGADDRSPGSDTPLPDAGANPTKIAPQEPDWVDQKLGTELAQIMQDFQTMKFSTQEGAEAFLDTELAKHGIGFETSSTGQKLVDAGPQDPLGVVDQLSDLGVDDPEIVNGVLEEVNGAVARFESLLHQAQSALTTLDPTAPDYADSVAAAVTHWDTTLRDTLSVDPPSSAQTAPRHVSFDVKDGLVAATVGGAGAPAGRESPHGLRIRAGLGLHGFGADGSRAPLAHVDPGQELRSVPIVSVFSDDAWRLRA